MLHVFRGSATGVALLLVALMLYAGEPTKLWWWAMAIPFAAWIIGAATAPYLLAKRSTYPAAQWLLFALFLISNLWAGSVYAEAFFHSTSSTASLVLVFIPLYQWAFVIAVAAAIGVITLIDRWLLPPE